MTRRNMLPRNTINTRASQAYTKPPAPQPERN